MTENELMLTSLLDCRRIDLYSRQIHLTSEQEKRLKEIEQRRALGEPLQYLLGSCDFLGLKLKVDSRVLIPRPETEILVDVAIIELSEFKINRPLKVLELGTGSGNIAISLAKIMKAIEVTSIEISQEALGLARENAALNDVDSKIIFVQADMEYFLKEQIRVGGKWDLIISNPPYIPSGKIDQLPLDVQHEPRQALDGGEDGLKFYRSIFMDAPQVLSGNGFILVEMGDGQCPDIIKIVRQNCRFQEIIKIKDHTGTDRILMAKKLIQFFSSEG